MPIADATGGFKCFVSALRSLDLIGYVQMGIHLNRGKLQTLAKGTRIKEIPIVFTIERTGIPMSGTIIREALFLLRLCLGL